MTQNTERTELTISAMVCQECDWRGSSVNQAIGHELNRHGGAQTCWWDRESPSVINSWEVS